MLKLNEVNQNSTVFIFMGNIAWNNQNSYLLLFAIFSALQNISTR